MSVRVLTNLELEATPVDPSHVVNIAYVNDLISGKIKAPVRLVSTINIAGTYTAGTLELGAAGPFSVDGVAVAIGDRILLVEQTTATQNGVYSVTDAGNGGPAELHRADDFDTSDKIYSGVAISVREGGHANTTWRLVTTGTITLDSTALEFIPVAPLTAASKFGADIIGDDVLTQFPLVHNLASTDVSVSIRDLADNAMVIIGWTIDNANSVTVHFDEPPSTADHYRVVVLG